MPLCFDLDGTLGHFGGGYVLLREALGQLWGAAPSVDDLAACKGSTDWEIVSELQTRRGGGALTEAAYRAYEDACLARFQATFAPGARRPDTYHGLVQGLTWLLERGHRVWLVSGNCPRVLAWKAEALGVDPRIPRLGSLPGLDRAGLIRRALDGCPGPHLYVGDRPHDHEAAMVAGVPFLGVGPHVPGPHLALPQAARPEVLVEAAERLAEQRSFGP